MKKNLVVANFFFHAVDLIPLVDEKEKKKKSFKLDRKNGVLYSIYSILGILAYIYLYNSMNDLLV